MIELLDAYDMLVGVVDDELNEVLKLSSAEEDVVESELLSAVAYELLDAYDVPIVGVDDKLDEGLKLSNVEEDESDKVLEVTSIGVDELNAEEVVRAETLEAFESEVRVEAGIDEVFVAVEAVEETLPDQTIMVELDALDVINGGSAKLGADEVSYTVNVPELDAREWLGVAIISDDAVIEVLAPVLVAGSEVVKLFTATLPELELNGVPDDALVA